ncbi:TolC family protein [Deminuibacter soli]|uniref:TolC family protein n=1 Tax=Deminuibacter soli TaxID=2291815 RepID=A0A3E1NCQ8_9BACT|nr:TolC family protein [Deminuibacter soli]RFM25795.1 TolC family protein [Deminuibacter soli]
MIYDRKLWTLVLLLFSGCLTSAATQQQSADSTLTLTLNDVWQKAAANSKTALIAAKAVAIRRELTADAIADKLPDAELAANFEKTTNLPVYDNGLLHSPYQHAITQTHYKTDANFFLTLYNGHKLNLKIEEDKMLQQIAETQQRLTLSDVRYKAAAAYLELQKATVFKQLILTDIERQEKQLAQIKENYKNGVLLKSDLLRVELDLNRRRLTREQVENDIRIANQQLNILIGEKDEQPVQPEAIADPSLNPPGSYDDYVAIALQHAYSYHAAAQQTELSKIKLKEAKANTQPKVGLYGDFNFAYPQTLLYPYNPNLYSIGVMGVRASFPIASLYKNAHKVKAAQLELEKETYAHEDAADKLRQQVREVYLRYKEALVQIELARENVARATENERIVKNTYFNNVSLITDLLDADVQLLQSQFELEAARILAQNKYYLLQNIIGNL